MRKNPLVLSNERLNLLSLEGSLVRGVVLIEELDWQREIGTSKYGAMKRLKLNALFEDKAIGEDSDINTF